jgi:hypothetical protein
MDIASFLSRNGVMLGQDPSSFRSRVYKELGRWRLTRTLFRLKS